MIIDTHIHLDDKQYDEDITEVIERAYNAGIKYFINPAGNIDSCMKIAALSETYKEIIPVLGIHPHDASSFNIENEAKLKELIKFFTPPAVGEIGLDYHYDFSPRDIQKEVFCKMLAISKECKLPVIIHCREAFDDMFEILEQEKRFEYVGVFHCFSGNIENAKKCLEMGFYLGITGVITFNKVIELKEIVKYAPIDKLLIETDGPYLSPIPHRGKRNESAYLDYIIDEISKIKGIKRSNVIDKTTQNAIKLFSLNL